MKFHLGSKVVLPVVLVLILLGGGVAAGETKGPPWSGEVYDDLKDWSEKHNDDPDNVQFPGKSLLRNEVVNLHIGGTDGKVANYSFRTDSQVRVLDLQEGHQDDATFRITTERTVIENFTERNLSVADLGKAFLIGDIRVKKIFRVMGEPIAVGPAEVVGVLALAAGAVVAAKTGVLGRLSKGFGAVESFLQRLAGLVAALEVLGVDVKGRLRALWKRLTSPFRGKGGSVAESTSEEELPNETEREPRADPERELSTDPEGTK